MYDPHLPRGVYFRRRVGALAGSVLALVALIWLVDGLLGSDGEEPIQGVAASSPLLRTPPPASKVVPSSKSAPSSKAAAPSAGASASASPAPRQPEQVPPDPSAPCPDSSVKVTAETGQRAYHVSERPLLRLVIVNAGPVPCTYDISRARRELVVSSGEDRVWSSNDCYFGTRSPYPRVLEPRERHGYQVRWTARTSTPGCPARRADVAPGEYLVTPKLGPITGQPVSLTLTR
ncbi:hypothetical protein ACFQV2_01805 [Actinokineospora soli]|uniref:Intracellular proteinase inhibitor n=1 Tax=Actinokineospora soli TaxID=1048753 RepID=A0ABW2TGP5_9PSEU